MTKTPEENIANSAQLLESIARKMLESTELSRFVDYIDNVKEEILDIIDEQSSLNSQQIQFLEISAEALELTSCACCMNQWGVADESLAEAISNMKLAVVAE